MSRTTAKQPYNADVMTVVGGKVGIGNESPSEKLDVAGNVVVSGTVNANISVIAPNIVYTTNNNQNIDGNKTFLKSFVGNGADNRLPNQIADKDESIMTRDAVDISFVNNLWRPLIFDSSLYRSHSSEVNMSWFSAVGTIDMSASNSLVGSWGAFVPASDVFLARGAGNTQRYAQNFSYMLEMDSSAVESSAETFVTFGFARSGSANVPNGTVPIASDKCLFSRISSGKITLTINHPNGTSYSSRSEDIRFTGGQILQDKELFLFVWDGESFFVYTKTIRMNSDSPNQELNWRLVTSIRSSVEIGVNETMLDHRWMHLHKSLVENSASTIVFGPGFYARKAIHPIRPIPTAASPTEPEPEPTPEPEEPSEPEV
jgi:hypothetical protein